MKDGLLNNSWVEPKSVNCQQGLELAGPRLLNLGWIPSGYGELMETTFSNVNLKTRPHRRRQTDGTQIRQ